MGRVALLVPAYHPARDLIVPFLKAARRAGFAQIIVVDDGSGPDYEEIFDELEQQLGCHVLRHDLNLGKGRALKTAIDYCEQEAEGLLGAVTADSDGQHAPADIVRVAERLLDRLDLGQPAVVLGVRRFDEAHVPPRSRLGNTVTSAAVRTFFGQHVSDTQTGLRGFPMALAVRSSHVRGERFDYEMNVLLWLLSSRTPVDEVPIDTIYHDLQNSVSHFRPVVDSARIYSVILRQFIRFSGASIVSAVLDIALYVALLDLVFGEGRGPTQVALAVVAARVISAMFNFVVNKVLVFNDDSQPVPSLARYATLAVVLLIASTLGTTAMSIVTGGHDVWAKIAVDGTLFLMSYFVQERWVFRDRSLERDVA